MTRKLRELALDLIEEAVELWRLVPEWVKPYNKQ